MTTYSSAHTIAKIRKSSCQESHTRTNFSWPACETKKLITQLHTTNTQAYESYETLALAKAFAQTHNLKQGVQEFGDKESKQQLQNWNNCMTSLVSSQLLSTQWLTNKGDKLWMHFSLSQKKEMIESREGLLLMVASKWFGFLRKKCLVPQLQWSQLCYQQSLMQKKVEKLQ